MKLKVFTADGSSFSEKDFQIPEFEGEKGQQALKQVLLGYVNNRRQGNASTKTRSEVNATGKKPFRQKGTGMARQGTRVAPQHTHGGVAFGPKPRDYSQRLNKKMKKLALSRALFDRVQDGDIAVIEKWEVADKKTRPQHALYLSPGDKMVFGPEKEHGLAVDDANRPIVVGADDAKVMVHDPTNESQALILSRLSGAGLPMPLGVLYGIRTSTYDEAINAPMKAQREAKGGTLQQLLESGETWRVG